MARLHPLKRWSRDTGYSLSDLARKIGLTHSCNIFRYINGTRTPDRQLRTKISRHTNGAVKVASW